MSWKGYPQERVNNGQLLHQKVIPDVEISCRWPDLKVDKEETVDGFQMLR